MSASTIYDMRLRMLLEDRATKGVTELGKAAERASRSTSSLSGALGRIGAMAAGFVGLGAAKRSMVDFNAGLEEARVRIAGLMQINLGGTWEENFERGRLAVERFSSPVAAAVASVEELAELSALIAGPLGRAGKSTSDITELTVRAAAAAKAYGVNAITAAREIENAMAGQMQQRGRFARALLAPMGFTTKDFNAQSEGRRLALLVEAFSSPAIDAIIRANEQTFRGSFEVFKAHIAEFLGNVGLPMFKALSAEVQRWNAWMRENQARMRDMGKALSEGVVKAFTVVREVGAFFLAHREFFMALAKVWLVSKGVGLLGSAWGALAAGARTLAGVQGFKGLAGVLGGRGGVIAGLAAVAFGARAFADWVDRRQSAEIDSVLTERFGGHGLAVAEKLTAARAIAEGTGVPVGARPFADEWERARQAMGMVSEVDEARLEARRHALTMLRLAHEAGALTETTDARGRQAFALDEERLRKQLASETSLGTEERRRTVREAVGAAVALLARDNMLRFQLGEVLAKREEEKPAASKGTHIGEVNIHRIEVVSDDADRFVFNLQEALADLVRNPAGAVGAFPRRM